MDPDLLRSLLDLIAGRRVVASVSGGKDSAALSLWLTELGIDHDRVFADTGWEHPATYEYLRGPLTAALGPISEVHGRDGGMVPLVRRKNMFPSRLRRFCTEELKVKPLARYVHAKMDGTCTNCWGTGDVGPGSPEVYGYVCQRCERGRVTPVDVVNAVGIRAAESDARAELTEWEASDVFDCDVWRPLLRWTEQDVIDIHHRHGLAPNPLYLRGATRVGCWPCIFARKAEIRLVADLSPDRIAVIRALEAEIPPIPANADHPDPLPRTYFHGKSTREGVPHPIDEVVEWSRTERGGRQFLLLDTEPPGCVRWGLCESAPPDPPA